MFENLGEKKNVALANMGKNIPLRRVGEADEVASAIVMMMENKYMTGTTIDVDGGVLLP
jgi:3-oxoacyl-[acyl-carrier protein] reductase